MRSPGPSFDLRAALTAEVRAALDELETDAVEAKAVHRVRLRLKRSRGLARVGRIGAPGLARVFNDSARACMRLLAPARDATAIADAAHEAARKERKRARQALNDAAGQLDMARIALSAADLERVRSALKDLLALAQVWPEASARQIARGARRVARRAKRARRRSIDAEAGEWRHVWRKREKERLYVAEILGKAWPLRCRRRITEKLGNLLGRERDARLLVERLRQSAPANEDGPAKRAIKALEQREKKLQRRANKLGRRLKRI